jgi:hypothetical protein
MVESPPAEETDASSDGEPPAGSCTWRARGISGQQIKVNERRPEASEQRAAAHAGRRGSVGGKGAGGRLRAAQGGDVFS